MKLALRSQRSFANLGDVVEALANADVAQDLVDGLALNPLTALRKSGGRVRPLAAPDCLRRLTAATLCAQHKTKFREDLDPHQFATGVPAGAEILGKAAQAHCDITGFGVGKIDGTNAFNRQQRTVAFAELRQFQPQLVPFAAQFYDRRSVNVARGQDGKAILIQSDCGWDQGGPFAPVGFSYGLKTALLDCQALLRNLVLEATGDSQLVDQVRTWACLDDIFFLSRRIF